MSMTKFGSGPRASRLALVIAVVTVLGIWGVLYPRDPSTAWGALTGGGLVILAMAALSWRARRSAEGGAFGRAVAGVPDERDALVVTKAYAWAGMLASLWMAGALIAAVLGADARLALTVAIFGHLLTLVVCYLVANRQS